MISLFFYVYKTRIKTNSIFNFFSFFTFTGYRYYSTGIWYLLITVAMGGENILKQSAVKFHEYGFNKFLKQNQRKYCKCRTKM
jgi:hypothetical protein